MLLVFFLLLSLYGRVIHGHGNGVSNFNFLTSNIVYGTKLPQTIEISGTYYLNADHPEIRDLKHASFFKSGVVTNRKHGAEKFNVKHMAGPEDGPWGPWICTGKEVVSKLAGITRINHDRVDANLKAMDLGINDINATAGRGSWTFDFKKAETFYSINKGCKSIANEMHNMKQNASVLGNLAGRAYEFSFNHTFEDFVPVLFTDYMGGAAFHYKQKKAKHDRNDDKGSPLRYCDGNKFGYSMYTMEPRPVCPIETPTRREHERGVVTVYKPNIVPVTRTVHKCQYGNTHLYSGQTFCCFAENYDNRPLVTVKKAASEDQCRYMVANQTDMYYGKMYPTAAGRHNFASFATHTPKRFIYSCCSSSSQDIGDAFYETAEMKVLMPSLTIVTPWGLEIPRSYLYKGTWANPDHRLVWEPFKKEDLCLHVPRITSDVEVIHYGANDELSEASTSPGGKVTSYFISNEVHAVWTADDTQEMNTTAVNKLNCIRQGSRDRIYLLKNGDIIKYSKGMSTHPPDVPDHEVLGTTTTHHEHASFVEITSPKNGTVTAVQNKHEPGHEKSDGSVIKVKDLPTPFKEKKKIEKPKPDTSKVTGTNIPTWQEAIAYIEYERTERQNENLHQRAITSCLRSQLEWDMFTQLLDISPSTAISGRLQDVVQATHGGNGFYNVKRCELVFESTVLPTMYTNSSLAFIVNGSPMTTRNISIALGVVPSDKKCFSYPIVKFKMSGSGQDILGQLTRDGRIDTLNAKHLEPCRPNRLLVFNLNDKISFYKDYRLEATVPAREVYSQIGTYKTAHEAVKQGSNAAVLDPLAEYISKINVIPLTPPLKEKKFKHYPTGQMVVDRYSLAEMNAGSESLMELMAEKTYSDYALKVWKKQTIVDWTGSSVPKGTDGLGSFAQVIGDLFVGGAEGILEAGDGIASGIGSGISSIYSGIGSGIGAIGSGIGSAVGDIGEGVGSAVGDIGEGVGHGIGALGDGIGGIFTTILLPILGVVAVAIGGYFVYTKFIAKDPKGDVQDELIDEHQQDDDMDMMEPPSYEQTQNEENEVRQRKFGGKV